MDWLQQLDVSLFRFINLTLRTDWLDAAMPFFNWNRLFTPFVALLVLLILIKGGARGRIFIALLVLSVAMTDGVVCYNLKAAIGRLRPFKVIEDAHRLVGSSGHGSMPSSITGTACGSSFRRLWWSASGGFTTEFIIRVTCSWER
jgi:hypothetical protein